MCRALQGTAADVVGWDGSRFNKLMLWLANDWGQERAQATHVDGNFMLWSADLLVHTAALFQAAVRVPQGK